jgi:hypothetical protein
MSDDSGRSGRVAGHHYRAYPQPCQLGDERGGIGSRWITERDESDELQGFGSWPCDDCKDSESLFLKFIDRSRTCRGRFGKRDDRAIGALDDPQALAVFVGSARLRQLLGWVERYKLDQLRRIGFALLFGGDSNRSVDRVLTAIRARERRQRQHVRFIEARHRTNAVYRGRLADGDMTLVWLINRYLADPHAASC